VVGEGVGRMVAEGTHTVLVIVKYARDFQQIPFLNHKRLSVNSEKESKIQNQEVEIV
jgi:hypothetical protein